MYRILLIECTPDFVHRFTNHYKEYVIVDAPMTFDEEPARRKEIDAVIVGGGLDSFLRYRDYLNEKVSGIPLFICTTKWKNREAKEAFSYGVWDYYTDEEFFTRREDVLSSLAKIIAQRSLEENWKKEKAMLENIFELNPYSISIWDGEGYFMRGNRAHLRLFKIQPLRDEPIFDEEAGFSEEQKETIRKNLKEKHKGKGFNIFLEPFLWKKDAARYAERWRKGERVSYLPIRLDLSQLIPGQPEHSVYIKGECFSVKNNAGTVEYYVVMHEDISAVVKAEEKREKKLKKRGAMPEGQIENNAAEPSKAKKESTARAEERKKPADVPVLKSTDGIKKIKSAAPGLTFPEQPKKPEPQHRKSRKKK
ncbi:MAG: hypothetical protein AB2L14_27760 [Candidatus Xenobiia bacterium LiM19]